MTKPITIFFLAVFALSASAQPNAKQPAAPTTQPYGKVDIADLEMKKCDFEPDANAEVLFDLGKLQPNKFERHVRIKIFNDFGKGEANMRLLNVPAKDIEGETINLIDGKIEITPLDKKLIYTENGDRFRTFTEFALPNVKAGSIIEFKLKGSLNGSWFFQSNLPTRYSEIQASFPGGYKFKFIPHVNQPYVKDIGKSTDLDQTKALANVHSLPSEPFMGVRANNLQRIEYYGSDPLYGTWQQIGTLILKYFNTDQRIDGSIKGEREIIKKADSLKTADDKIAFIYNLVKTHMKWNNIATPFPANGATKVWDDQTGNSSEINWIVYHLLKKAKVKSYPMMVSDNKYGKLNPLIPGFDMLNKMVVYIPVDSSKNYLLDATNKYNMFNVVPTEELNTYGFNIDEDNMFFQTFFFQDLEPAMQSTFINAEIQADGKMSGTAEINSFAYNKINAVSKYKTDGEEKYSKYLGNNDNNIKISSLKLEGLDIDTIPLTQKFNFDISLASSDENYTAINTNLFTLMGENPFKNEERYSDIDFGYQDNYLINGVYKLPSGYKIDALPKSLTIVTPDESIVFKRIIAEDSGTVLVKYSLTHRKTMYFRDDYQDLRAFYKKMYEVLNEQIILKKL